VKRRREGRRVSRKLGLGVVLGMGRGPGVILW
jgi:hypothetical protein